MRPDAKAARLTDRGHAVLEWIGLILGCGLFWALFWGLYAWRTR